MGGLQQRSTQNDDEQDEQGENYGGYCPEACAERQLWPTARLSIIPQLGSPAFVGSSFLIIIVCSRNSPVLCVHPYLEIWAQAMRRHQYAGIGHSAFVLM